MKYSIRKQSNRLFDETIQNVKDELAKEGFGILTEIDVKATLKKKLDVDWDRYAIIGACNPPFAYKALQTEKEIGLLLPCNLIVYEDAGKVFVSAIRPTESMKTVGSKAVASIASEVEEKLKKVVDAISEE